MPVPFDFITAVREACAEAALEITCEVIHHTTSTYQVHLKEAEIPASLRWTMRDIALAGPEKAKLLVQENLTKARASIATERARMARGGFHGG